MMKIDFNKHVQLLADSYQRLIGESLMDIKLQSNCFAEDLKHASFGLVSHGVEEDPVFNYANDKALELFEFDWEDFIQLPSRKSAEPVNRQERARMLSSVAQKGYIDDYQGVRISANGKRFRIMDSVVWNLIDEAGIYRGQAAKINRWEYL